MTVTYIITLRVDAPPGQEMGLKEHYAMCGEKFGDTRVISVEEIVPKQIEMEGK